MEHNPLNQTPVFSDLPEAERSGLLELARRRDITAGEVLFYEGDPANEVMALSTGRCGLSWAGESRGELHPGALVDPVASLGGLPHTVKVTALEDSAILSWSAGDLWCLEAFAAAARCYLAALLRETGDRLRELEAPIHYPLSPGPFLFEEALMVIAFCEVDPDAVMVDLPDGLSLLRPPGRKRAPLFLAFASFPRVYPQHDEMALFSYTETTYFIPVRHRANPGLYVPHIYPSAWEPILLGREIYGFPKQLGHTVFGSNSVSLAVDGEAYLALHWTQLETIAEPHLVGALMGWLGLERHLASAAFQAGDLMRKAMRLPPYRRVDVYNHKQVLAADATHEASRYEVDCLTQAVFGVLHWHNIARIGDPVLEVTGGPYADSALTVGEAYRTYLNMRLSTGKVVRDYTK